MTAAPILSIRQLFTFVLALTTIGSCGVQAADNSPANTANATTILAPADQRFASRTNEIPHLRRHVVPLLTRLGCSAAACHGAKEGQGGFELSLFGFDYAADVVEIADEGDPPRANWKEPLESALLCKPTLMEDHLGGKRFEAGGWEYQLLMQWVAARAPGVKSTQAWVAVDRLEIRPSKIVLPDRADAASQQVQVIAHWNDGTAEDVTPLCRFQLNDDAVAAISTRGEVSRVAAGDTHLVAFYDKAIASAPVYAIQGDQPRVAQHLSPVGSVDAAIDAKLDELGVIASPICSDEEFLRRVSIDLAGTLPTAEEVQSFAESDAPDKRAKKIDELLASEQYVAWWSTWLCDLTGNNQTTLPSQDFQLIVSKQWYDWIAKRVRDNVPYDQIVEGMVVSPGRLPDQSYAEYCAEMTSYARQQSPADFGQRSTLPYFWARTNLRTPATKTLAFSYTFLGVQIQCAECHKHPFDRWTTEDFKGLQGFFTDIRFGRPPSASQEHADLLAEIPVPEGSNSREVMRNRAAAGEIVPWEEVYFSQTRPGTSPELPLKMLMEWMKGLDHPYMAMAMVNRVWHHYFGIGIVDPPDDLSLANPPSNQPLLDYLTAGFVASGYDMKWLHRQIVGSEAYQRSIEVNSTNQRDARNFSHSHFRRLPAEVLYDAVSIATAADQRTAATASGTRAVGQASGLVRGDRRFDTLTSLGKPPRMQICERERADAPSLTQSMFLQNHPDLHAMIDRRDGWVASLTASDESPDELIRQAFFRTLSRTPTEKELQQSREFVASSESPAEGWAGLLWALLNSKEFSFNH